MKNTELLIYMLEDIRKVTLKGISGLTKEQLFAEPVQAEFSIGSYLMHLGEADLAWLEILEGRQQPDDLKKQTYYGVWYDYFEESKPPKQAPEPGEYIDVITKCRERVINNIRSAEDSSLDEKVYRKWTDAEGKEHSKEYTRKWIFYHLIEHEAHTRGQMFMLMRMAGFKKKGENG